MLITDDGPTLRDCVELYGMDWEETMSDYPIFDEGKREWLNARIYEHFAYREIAQETPSDHFRLIRRTMHEMMPALNPMFSVLDGEIDILAGYASAVEHDSEARQLFSATPQTQLSAAENYATNLTDATSSESSKTSGRSMPAGDMLTSWATSVNNALYLVYNGLEPYYLQIFD
jgi:hypothetical protein